MMAVIGSRDSLPISLGTPGLVGLALSYAAPIVSLLGSFLTSFTETEKEMVSVERVLQYMDIPQEELNGCQSLSPNWPSEGYIMFQNVSLRYLPSLPDALHDITFTISGGTQVGIIGRTGAGKSSILNALFRLTPICKGCILVDGLDIADVPVRDLRSHFAVVPQSPFLFEGSLRDNLDPFRVSDDLKIWKTLERCHVREEVEVAGGLDIHVKESGTSFSVGQRQLLCLARALLKSSKGNKVCQLKKALYGLKQSPKAWFGRSLQRNQLSGCKPENTPIKAGHKLDEPESPLIERERKLSILAAFLKSSRNHPISSFFKTQGEIVPGLCTNIEIDVPPNSSSNLSSKFAGPVDLLMRYLELLVFAPVRHYQVLCLDECTANIDAQTSSVLQNAILTECRGMTVITIAHRISTVLSMDNILILDRGILVEQGNPQVLLQDHSSRFSGLLKLPQWFETNLMFLEFLSKAIRSSTSAHLEEF
ncbi:ABC transporter C family member 13 [Vitis vinifera]|uniref:ABC-type xenobiotic transporter n=1 Tax=Vitis vinifera TaxID=29760 RepID=A0A438HLA9_VITVI|nr:ABC transporter C family member 13 [Vitis vinifera]